MKAIHWFRQDLRLKDNPALYEAAKSGEVLPIYILTDHDAETLGGASKWWLYHSLLSLKKSLGGKLLVLRGNPKELIIKLVNQFKIDRIYWNRCYEKHNLDYDYELQNTIPNCQIYNGRLLWDPGNVLKSDGTPYRVFTPFYRGGCLQNPIAPRIPLSAPKELRFIDCAYPHTGDILALELLSKVTWYEKFNDHWTVGEGAAIECLDEFLKNRLYNYKVGRDFPSENYVSKLSPYLHFGEISPNQIWYNAIADRDIHEKNVDHFLSELGWREFSYNLLYHFPSLQVDNLNQKFDRFPWINDENLVKKWQNGETGFPIVDAGMRELWATGYMHNRVRMIVASFLVKNLLVHWHEGERWFWDCLVDADMANNAAGWQWVAGSGADAAPYFRIFNPVTQGIKFDPNGAYIRKYLPEIRHLPDEFLFKPWTFLEKVNYPRPMVELDNSRKRSLEAFASLKA
jgi:deoxyribodipyrimidine photo-lyase